MRPEGRCPVCKLFAFVDGHTETPGGRLRAHAELASLAKRPPNCRGTGQPATEMRWPNGDEYLGDRAAVRLQWPGGNVYWEGL